MRRSIAALAALLMASCGSQDQPGDISAESNEGAAASGGAGGAGGSATASMTPGWYETTIETLRINMTGGPALPAGITPPAPPPITVRACLTAAEAARPNADFFSGGARQAGCTYEDFSIAGGRIQGTMTCTREGSTMRITMNGQFSADGYQMEQESRVEARGFVTESAMRMTSRRVGDCPGT